MRCICFCSLGDNIKDEVIHCSEIGDMLNSSDNLALGLNLDRSRKLQPDRKLYFQQSVRGPASIFI